MRMKFKNAPVLSTFRKDDSEEIYIKTDLYSALRLSSKDRLTIDFEPDTYIELGFIEAFRYKEGYGFGIKTIKVKDLNIGSKFICLGKKYIVSEDDGYKKIYIGLDTGKKEKNLKVDDLYVDELLEEIN